MPHEVLGSTPISLHAPHLSGIDPQVMITVAQASVQLVADIALHNPTGIYNDVTTIGKAVGPVLVPALLSLLQRFVAPPAPAPVPTPPPVPPAPSAK